MNKIKSIQLAGDKEYKKKKYNVAQRYYYDAQKVLHDTRATNTMDIETQQKTMIDILTKCIVLYQHINNINGAQKTCNYVQEIDQYNTEARYLLAISYIQEYNLDKAKEQLLTLITDGDIDINRRNLILQKQSLLNDMIFKRDNKNKDRCIDENKNDIKLVNNLDTTIKPNTKSKHIQKQTSSIVASDKALSQLAEISISGGKLSQDQVSRLVLLYIYIYIFIVINYI